MGRQPKQQASPEWLATLTDHIRVDLENGLLYWKTPGRGKNLHKPIGCLDSNGYIKVQINRVSTYVHIVIYYFTHGYWPDHMVDHRNTIRNDNRPDNLRAIDHSGNAMNGGLWSTNSTGVRGVSWSTAEQKFKVTKQGVHLGYFKNLNHAKAAYETA